MLEILVADDDPAACDALSHYLSERGHRVAAVHDGAQAIDSAGVGRFDLLLLDLEMPFVDGRAVFRHVRKQTPQLPVVFISGTARVDDAVDLVREQATDFIGKPLDFDRLLRVVAMLDERKSLAKPSDAPDDASTGLGLVGRSGEIVAIRDHISRIAAADGAVLITGESGTGKELLARAIHRLSPRRNGPFIAVNCAAIPEPLFEAELFGHERGAFTGAVRARDGRLKAADGGTLFLDEVGEMPPAAQAKLLRALDGFSFEPVGSNRSIRASVRLVSATHRDLRDLTSRGQFREDLYYRLKLFAVRLPPLRERRADLRLLVQHFLCGSPATQLSPTAWAALSSYSFPGNVRELRHALEHAQALARDGVIQLEDLPEEIRGRATTSRPAAQLTSLAAATAQFEIEYVQRAVELAGGNRTRAAALLGITRKTLWEKLSGRRQRRALVGSEESR